MLTAKSQEIDKVESLGVGADDHICKPFGVLELQARIKALLRRSKLHNKTTYNKHIISKKNIVINIEKHEVKKNEQLLNLTSKEFDLLLFLIQNSGKVYNREQLLHFVWNTDFNGYEHTVNSHINRLRMKIEDDPNKPQYIKTK